MREPQTVLAHNSPSAMFVLIHSPLVGDLTWSRVAEEMRRRDIPVRAPHLRDVPDSRLPYWQQHAAAVAHALNETPPDTRVILVGHSGAGPLLPAIAHAGPRPVAGYMFVDAGILFHDASHLDLRAQENAEGARQFEAELRAGARYPTWTADDLCDILPDPVIRDALAADLQPRSLDFFTEILPAYDFPDAPCAYLQFAPWYDSYAAKAQARGWAFQKIEAGHFHMLVEPVRVTNAILDLTRGFGSQ